PDVPDDVPVPELDPPEDDEPGPLCVVADMPDDGVMSRPWSTLTMMSPNCSGRLSRPSVWIGSWNDCPFGAGGWPTWPAGASRFWLRMALATSMVVMPREASCCGSSQARML